MNINIGSVLLLTVGLAGCGGGESGDGTYSNGLNVSSEEWLVSDEWTLSWSDEFNDSFLDSSIWTHQVGYGYDGWGNKEWQLYTTDEANSNVADGVLAITALSDGPLGYQDGSITSARLVTKNNVDFQYGKIAAKIKVPTGQGMWPAFWMLGSNIDTVEWPACGEIDIMEKIGGNAIDERTVFGHIHYADPVKSPYTYGNWTASGKSIELNRYLSDDYHIYEIEWSESLIAWKIDGYQYHSESISNEKYDALKEPFFITLNIAVGGKLPGDPDTTTVFPQQMLVDWIRVYSND